MCERERSRKRRDTSFYLHYSAVQARLRAQLLKSRAESLMGRLYLNLMIAHHVTRGARPPRRRAA